MVRADTGPHPEHMLRCVLIGLGLAPAQAEAIAFMPLPELPAVIEGPIFSGLEPRAAPPRGRPGRSTVPRA